MNKKALNNDHESLLGSLPEDFFTRFKSMEELNDFMSSLFKRGVDVLFSHLLVYKTRKIFIADLVDHCFSFSSFFSCYCPIYWF